MNIKVILGLILIMLMGVILFRLTDPSVKETTTITTITEQNQQLLKAQAADLDNCHWQLLRLQGMAERLLEHFETCKQKGGDNHGLN